MKISLFALVLAVVMLASCTTDQSLTMSDGRPGIQLLPDMECKGKIVLSATGSLSASGGFGANASNAGTLQADCGDGFLLIHTPKAPQP